MGFEKTSILDSADALRRMKDDLGQIAETLLRAGAAPSPTQVGDKLDGASIRRLIRGRRLRGQLFRGDMFSDPAWDMMLDLFAARLEGQRVAVSSLCIAAAVPPTTALRWIKSLCDRGIFVRKEDPEDTRRVYIELSDETARQLENYFHLVREFGLGTL